MAFTQVTLTGTVESEPGTAVTGAEVSLTLSAPISDGSVEVYPQTQTCFTNGSGQIPAAFTFSANDDSTTVPAGTYYSVVIQTPDYTDKFNVTIPHSAAPTVDLFSLPRH